MNLCFCCRLRDWWNLGSNCDAYICGTDEAADIIDIQGDVESANTTIYIIGLDSMLSSLEYREKKDK